MVTAYGGQVVKRIRVYVPRGAKPAASTRAMTFELSPTYSVRPAPSAYVRASGPIVSDAVVDGSSDDEPVHPVSADAPKARPRAVDAMTFFNLGFDMGSPYGATTVDAAR